MKKLISILLSVILIMSCLSTIAFAYDEQIDESSDGGLYIRADGRLFVAEKGKTYTYYYYVACSEKVVAYNCTMNYDHEGLEFKPHIDENGEYTCDEYPASGLATICYYDKPGCITSGFVVSGVRLPVPDDGKYTDKNIVFAGDFTVTADSGIYDIESSIETLGGINNDKFIFNYEQVATDVYVGTNSEIRESVEKPDEVEECVYIRADNEMYKVEQGQTYSYTYYFECDKKISLINCETIYDVDGLEFEFEVDDNGEYTKSEFSRPDCAKINLDTNGLLVYGYSSASGLEFPVSADKNFGDNNVVFTGRFTVTAKSGVYDICTEIESLVDVDNNEIISGFEQVNNDTTVGSGGRIVLFVDQDDNKGDVYIRTDDYLYKVKTGCTYTYIFYLAVDKKIASIDCRTYYDSDGLVFKPAIDEYGDYTGEEFPNFKAFSNSKMPGVIYYNASIMNGIRLPVSSDGSFIDKNIMFKGEFTVTAESGVYDIWAEVVTLGDVNHKKIIFSSELVDKNAVINTSRILDQVESICIFRDADGDDSITVMDATAIQRYIAQLDEFDNYQLVVSDVDKDGEVAIMDATKIQMYLVGY